MALPILAAAGAFARRVATNALVNKAKDKLGGVFQAETQSTGGTFASYGIFAVAFLGFILVLAVSGGAAGEHAGVNNPRDPEGGPGQDIPPQTGDCSGIASIARAELGVLEQPQGSNDGPRVRQYTDNHPELWCADFVSWVLWQSGNRLDPNWTPSRNRYSSDPSAGREPGVVNLSSYFSRNEIHLPRGSVVQPGDIIFYDFAPGAAQQTHTGIVVAYDPQTRIITTVEGNTSAGLSGNQGVGSRRVRADNAGITGFGRLRNCQAQPAVTLPLSILSQYIRGES